jgi:hypothetical protein
MGGNYLKYAELSPKEVTPADMPVDMHETHRPLCPTPGPHRRRHSRRWRWLGRHPRHLHRRGRRRPRLQATRQEIPQRRLRPHRRLPARWHRAARR